MKVRILFAGLARGTWENWETLKRTIDKYDAEIYAGSQEIELWRPFFKELGKENLFETNTCQTHTLTDTVINESTHHVKKQTILQWSNLYLTYKHFEDRFEEDDIIIKLRNDWYLEETLPLDSIEFGNLYVPARETHSQFDFDPNILMNDQIVLGRKGAMKVYFEYPYRFRYPKESYEIPSPHHGVCNGLVSHPMHTSCGIEILLREYIRKENIGLKTFRLNYRRIEWAKPPGYFE